MKIAVIAPPFLSIPPVKYGGTEKIIYYLVEGLVKRGVDVTLFASGDSHTSATLFPVIEKPFGNSGFLKDNYLQSLMYFSKCIKEHQSFDIIHNHAQYLPLFLTDLISTPVIHTWHGSFYKGETTEERRALLQMMKHQKFISISNNQQQALPELNYIGTVYNGVDTNFFKFQPRKTEDKYIVWIGRIVAKKGPKTAILAALKAGIPIKLSAAIDPIEQPYFDAEIKPLVDNKLVTFLGELPPEELVPLYQNALCSLVCIEWHEPFGLVMAESMACGTPVIAYNIGSVPELITDGATGYIINNGTNANTIIKENGIEGMCKAIKMLDKMNENQYLSMRETARKTVKDNFSIDSMVENYIKIYQNIINHS